MATISDMDGQFLTQGLQGCDTSDVALQTARKMAAARGSDVMLDDDDGEWIVHPNGECDRHNAVALKLIEHGNGIDVDYGDRVYDISDDTLYRVVSSPGCIHTNDARGNYRFAEAVPVGDASDLTEQEWDSLPDVLIAKA